MGKAIVVILFFSCFIMTQAQDLRGKLFAEGRVGFNFSSSSASINGNNYNNPYASQSYDFRPSAGYYFTRLLAIGIQASYSSTKDNYVDFVYQNNVVVNINKYYSHKNTFTIAPILRYVMPATPRFGFNLTASVPYSTSKTVFTSTASSAVGVASSSANTGNIYLPDGETNTATSIGINVGPGFQWLVKENISIMGAFGVLSYSFIKTDASGQMNSGNFNRVTAVSKTNNFKLALDTGLGIGVIFYFSLIK